MLDAISYKTAGGRWLPEQPQGETIALTPNGKQLLLGSEGSPSTTYVVERADQGREGAEGRRHAAGGSVGEPECLEVVHRQAACGHRPRRGRGLQAAGGGQGTMLALGLAAAVAVVAGVVVAVVRRP